MLRSLAVVLCLVFSSAARADIALWEVFGCCDFHEGPVISRGMTVPQSFTFWSNVISYDGTYVTLIATQDFDAQLAYGIGVWDGVPNIGMPDFNRLDWMPFPIVQAGQTFQLFAPTAAVPEPAALLAMVIGLTGIGLLVTLKRSSWHQTGRRSM